MKKFSFSLGTVLDYKNQVLDALMTEHGLILAKVNQQEANIARLELTYKEHNQDYNRRKLTGMAIIEAQSYDGYFRVMDLRIKKEYSKLAELKKEEEKKRAQVVEAKKDTSSIEKLKEKKLEIYNKMIQKDEELFVDEFVSYQRVARDS